MTIATSLQVICTTLAAVALMASTRVYAQPSSTTSGSELIAELGLVESEQPVRQLPGWKPASKVLVQGGGMVSADVLRAALPGVQVVMQNEASERDIADADVLIGPCSENLLRKAKKVRWLQVLSAGIESCTAVPSLKERGILVTNMQRVQAPIIGEHAIALALALARNLEGFVANQAQGRWDRQREGLRVLNGKTMLVVGLGGIGTEIAKRAHALGMKVVATRASGHEGPAFVSYVGTPDELLKLAKDADVIASALPLTPATTKLFDTKFFAALKPSAYFINVGRGASVDTMALLAALNERRLAGAGLDVTEPEPLPTDHPLWRAPNVIITPHTSAVSDLPRDEMVGVIRENLRRYQAGEKMLSVVDLQRGY